MEILPVKMRKIPGAGAYILFSVLVLTMMFVEPSDSSPYLVPKDPGVFVRPRHKSERSVPSVVEGNEAERNSSPPPSASSPTIGRKPPTAAGQEVSPSTISGDHDSVEKGNTGNKEVLGAKDADDGPDDQAIQRTFLVLAGLGVIIGAYFAIKFACGKKRRRSRDEESTYGLVETSEMDLLDNDEEEEEDDDTLFDLQSHRRT